MFFYEILRITTLRKVGYISKIIYENLRINLNSIPIYNFDIIQGRLDEPQCICDLVAKLPQPQGIKSQRDLLYDLI